MPEKTLLGIVIEKGEEQSMKMGNVGVEHSKSLFDVGLG